MSLISQSTLNATEIDRINAEMLGYVRHQLIRSYELVAAYPQAVLDALGAEAMTAITRYATFYAALDAVGEAAGVVPPDYAMFAPQPDGTVIYTAPEPEPEPAPES